MRWYMATYAGDSTPNDYERFPDDKSAIDGFTRNVPDGEVLLEIYRCDDDECLTPEDRPIWF